MKFTVYTSLIWIFASVAIIAEDIKLPLPQRTGGKPLMEALNDRKSIRDFDKDKEISGQELSNLLWAAFGINREKSQMRTAPSAHNCQEIDIYVAMKSGFYLYLAKDNVLKKVGNDDVRVYCGKQSFVKSSPLVFILVADYKKMADEPKSIKDFYAAIDAGYISQNIYLYCASIGLGTVAIGYLDKELLKKNMKLRPEQNVMITQPVGYPTK